MLTYKEDLLNALQVIFSVCYENEDCHTCPLRKTKNGGLCNLKSGEVPCKWDFDYDPDERRCFK